LELHDVPLQSEWKEGDRVITSGLGTVFPRGLLVGWVEGSAPDAAGRGKKVLVRPAASPAQTDELFFLVPSQRGAERADEPDMRHLEARSFGSGGHAVESGSEQGRQDASPFGAAPEEAPSLPASDLYPVDPLVEQSRAAETPSGGGVILVP
jgi:hypothetical protein